MTSRFDFPLPRLDISTDFIDIETNDKYEGSFTIKNTGGGTLSGQILSRCTGFVFSPAEWVGNTQTIAYTFNAADAGLTTGQSMESHVVISSNGGEQMLPVTAKLTKMSIVTAEGFAITNLQEFYEYANSYPAQARRLFVVSEFYALLLAIGYEYMEIYESLHKDANRERALDNFFILSGLKRKTTFSVEDTALKFVQNPNDNALLYGHITVQKSDNGYVEAPIIVKDNSPWLNFYASKLVQSDFKETLGTMVNFSIDPMQVTGTYARELVTIGTPPKKAAASAFTTQSGYNFLEHEDNTVEIEYRRAAPVVLRLDRAAYGYEDKGVIQVTNNTGKDMKVEIHCPESYVRFSARSYLIGAYGEIPFNIKLSAFLSAQLFFRKLPYMKTAIEVRANVQGKAYRKLLPIIVGQW